MTNVNPDIFGVPERPERTKERIQFMTDLVWEVIPERPEKAKKKQIVWENAENYYERNRQRFLDDPGNSVLTETAGGDKWVRASYIRSYWSDVKDNLAMHGNGFKWNKRGIYKSDNSGIEEVNKKRASALKTQLDRLTYRALLYLDAAGNDLDLYGFISQIVDVKKLTPGEILEADD